VIEVDEGEGETKESGERSENRVGALRVDNFRAQGPPVPEFRRVGIGKGCVAGLSGEGECFK